MCSRRSRALDAKRADGSTYAGTPTLRHMTLPDIDFTRIRPWRGSRHSGFEELCCQLFSLESPAPASRFFRKEGAGGDAGVECLWTLSDGQVHGLQSKYFCDELGPTQWRQLDDSVRTALEKHPTLTRYVISLPRDLTDRRREGEQSQRDHWGEHLATWHGWAEAKDMDVDFVYWGSSELAERLSRDEAHWSGRTLYWFGTRSMNPDWFQRKFEQARANLGERYTPEANVDLPIRDVFDGLSRTPAFRAAVSASRGQIRKAVDRFTSSARELDGDEKFVFDRSPLEEALGRLDQLLDIASLTTWEEIPAARMAEEALVAVDQLEALEQSVDDWAASTKGDDTPRGSGPGRDTRYFGDRLARELLDLARFTRSTVMASANVPALLVDGDAGMGKSHLLADIARVRLTQGWPTLLLLGQHVSQGNPWDAFLSDLDLRSHSVEQVLGALDAAGQASGVRSLLLVDAINEGGGRGVWRDHVAGFLSQAKRFPHVAVCLTCRTTYVRSIFGDGPSKDTVVRTAHRGFEGHESRAAAIYLDRYGIARPTTPLLAPEFGNPLFLKTCCEALNRQGKTAFPKGVRGIQSVFRLYVESLDATLADRLDLDPHAATVERALRGLATRMADSGRGVVPREDAAALLEDLHPSSSYSRSLLYHLVGEGALAEDLEYPADAAHDPVDVIRFTFERFSDHFVAERLLDDFGGEDIEVALADDGPLGTLLRDRGSWHLRGVVDALAIQVPERYGRELIALLEGAPVYFDLADGFLQSIIWREPKRCTEETAEWLNKVQARNGGDSVWDTLLQVTAEADHPFNADRLHRTLMAMDLPDRDASWSIYLAQRSWADDEDVPESIARTLVGWAWDSDASGADFGTARLAAIALTWFLTTSSRVVRDQATKALVSLVDQKPALALELMEAFGGVDDPYVSERLYGCVYGAALQGMEADPLRQIASEVYRRVFESGSPPPHILLRDYARGTIEYARHRGCLASHVDLERVVPPYSSDPWPLTFPSAQEVEESDYDSIRSSVLSMGDFGRYIMGDSSDWSVTPLTAGRPETHRDRVGAFRRRLADDPNPGVLEAFEALGEVGKVASDAAPGGAAFLRLVQRVADDAALTDMPGREEAERLAEEVDEAETTFLAALPEAEREYYRSEIRPYVEWGGLHHLADGPVRFDIMAERRWVWRRAHGLGWSADKFEWFEGRLTGTRRPRAVERIGKKYQWIAWHELQARLSDHLFFIGSTWRETEGTAYEGPWQLSARDIDPSLLVQTEARDAESGSPKPVWWQPERIVYADDTTEERVARLWSDEGFPDVRRMLEVRDPQGASWYVLDAYATWPDREDARDPRPRWDTWVSFHAFLVGRSHVPDVIRALADDERVDSKAFRNSLDYYAFLGEYPWHPVANPELSEWRQGAADPQPFDPLPVPYWVPTVEYVCESGRDQSVEARIDLRLPGSELRKHLGLVWSGGRGVTFRSDGSVVFMDPATDEDGPSATLVAHQPMVRMLDALELSLVWWVVGEKGLYGRGFRHEFHGRQSLAGIYYTDGSSLQSQEWRREQRPRD